MDYNDFSREWYLNVGKSISVTIFVAIVSPSLIDLVTYPMKKWWKLRKVKKAKT